jgi:hypothetical protein
MEEKNQKQKKKIDKNTFCMSLILLYGFIMVYKPIFTGEYQLGDILISFMFVVSILAYILPRGKISGRGGL